MLNHRFQMSPFSPVVTVHTNAFSKGSDFETRFKCLRFRNLSFQMSQAPFTLLHFRLKTEQNLSAFALRSHCSDMKSEHFEYDDEYGYFRIQCVLNTLRFQCEHR